MVSAAMRALVVFMLLALPLHALATNTASVDIPVDLLDSPAQAAMKKLAAPTAHPQPLRIADAEKKHPDLIVRLEEIRIYGRNEPEDYVGPKKSPMMQFRTRLENDITLPPSKKVQLALCLIGLCSIYGPEGIPLGDSPEVRADARINQSTTQLNAQFRGTLQ